MFKLYLLLPLKNILIEFFFEKSVGPPSLKQVTVMAVFDRKLYDIFNAFVCVIDVH